MGSSLLPAAAAVWALLAVSAAAGSGASAGSDAPAASVPSTGHAASAGPAAPAGSRSEASSPYPDFLPEHNLFYPTVYYPGVADTAQAQLIALAPGEESPDLLITMQTAGGVVTGTILGEAAGGTEPLEGVLVKACCAGFEALTRSNPDGGFILRGIPAGQVRILYATDDTRTGEGRYQARYHPGAADSSQAEILELEDGETIDLDPAVLPRGVVLGGDVRTADTGLPMAGLPVRIRETGSGRLWSPSTSDQGEYLQGGLPPGVYTLEAYAVNTTQVSAYYSSSGDPFDPTELTLSAGEERTGLEIRPPRGGIIWGDVREENGTPIPDTEVRATLDGAEEAYTARTDALGFYGIKGLPTGSYLVYAPAIRKYYPDTLDPEEARLVRVTAPQEVFRINLSGYLGGGCQLPPMSQGYIYGILEGEFETVTEGVVQAFSESDTFSVPVSGPGSYLIGCLPQGLYRVGLFTDGDLAPQYYPETNRWDEAEWISVAPPDSTKEIDFEPEASVKITGRIQDPEGRPIPGVMVRAEEPDLRLWARSRTDEAGRFSLTRLGDAAGDGPSGGLPAGAWRVAAESTLVPDPEITPVLQPVLLAEAQGIGSVVISWQLAQEHWWWCRLERSAGGADGAEGAGGIRGDWTLLWESLSGRGADGGRGMWIDAPAEPGIYLYRLTAWILGGPGEGPGPGGGWTALADPVELPAAGENPQALPRTLHPAPNPWHGRGALALRLDRASPVDGRLHLVSAAGRVLSTVFFPAGTDVLSWSWPSGSRPASGVYFLRLELPGQPGGPATTLLVVR